MLEKLKQGRGDLCVGTLDGALWISDLKGKADPKAHQGACHLARAGAGCELCAEEFRTIAGVKLPATRVLGALLRGVAEAPAPIDAPADHRTFREIVYHEEGQVGLLSFEFYSGAMSTEQCRRLRDAPLYARSRPTKVVALLGGPDFWSNGDLPAQADLRKIASGGEGRSQRPNGAENERQLVVRFVNGADNRKDKADGRTRRRSRGSAGRRSRRTRRNESR